MKIDGGNEGKKRGKKEKMLWNEGKKKKKEKGIEEGKRGNYGKKEARKKILWNEGKKRKKRKELLAEGEKDESIEKKRKGKREKKRVKRER